MQEMSKELEPEISITSWSNHWTLLPLYPTDSADTRRMKHRLNGLGTLFYYIKIVLRRHRLSFNLHKDWCDNLEKDSLREVIEIPRDHFKTTIHSEGLPMWRSMPFSQEDEDYMSLLGYSPEWIRWMKRAHNQDARWLLVSANIKNATKLGRRINHHYKNNDFFQGLFPEVQPTGNEPWAVESMTHRRTTSSNSGQGEGTYDFLGVGAALQSRHYEGVVEDDLFGLEALGSEVIMQDIIDYHKLLVGAFDSIPGRPDILGDEVVVGNRWQYEDLNSYLREFEPDFVFSTHSAIGGCCPLHPYGKPIFPEEFNLRKLARIEQRLGTYFYSCQYLNSPTPPGKTFFKESLLRFFHFERFNAGLNKEGNITQKVKLIHHVVSGEVQKDILPANLRRVMVVDPNHAGKNGRSRHCIAILGFNTKPPKMYLLEVWAFAEGYNEFVNKIFELGEKWKIKDPHIEEVGFQKFLAYHLEVIGKTRKSNGKFTFDRFIPLKTDNSDDAKTKRIEGMEPVYQRGEFYCSTTGCDQFLEEFRKYPYSKYKDVLDTLGHALTLWEHNDVSKKEIMAWLSKNKNYRGGQQRNSITGY